jgi:hypothetical protein
MATAEYKGKTVTLNKPRHIEGVVSKVSGFGDKGVLLAHIALAEVESGHRFDLARAVFSSAWNARPRWVGLFFHLEVDILTDIRACTNLW